MNSIEIEQRYGIPFCKRQSLAIVRGAGDRVWDSEGRQYLDFSSGWGVTSLGHCHPRIQQALQQQAALLMQNPNSGFTYSPARAELMLKLAPLLPAPLSHMYFLNSGAEANDAAIKMARKLTGRTGIVSTLRSFHGRTLNTLSASGSAEAAQMHRPWFPDNRFVPYDDLPAMDTAIDGQTAAVIVEPIQGEGGIRLPDPAYLSAVQKLCRARGALLIVDEIQTGICRSGSLFAVDQCQPAVEPDMMTLGKGLAGGFPFAALLMSFACASKVQPGDHGGTYCGNPLGCAVATAVLDYLLEHEVATRAAGMGTVLGNALVGLTVEYPDIIVEQRGRGLLQALQLRDEALLEQLNQACLQQGLMLIPTRNAVLRLLPSLLVSEAEIREAMDKLSRALAAVRAREITLDCCASDIA
jgi:acetylornithine/N-succinyldiaminopimelate aminotransferase